MIQADQLKELGWSDDLIEEVMRDAPRLPMLPIQEIGVPPSDSLTIGATSSSSTSATTAAVQAASAIYMPGAR